MSHGTVMPWSLWPVSTGPSHNHFKVTTRFTTPIPDLLFHHTGLRSKVSTAIACFGFSNSYELNALSLLGSFIIFCTDRCPSVRQHHTAQFRALHLHLHNRASHKFLPQNHTLGDTLPSFLPPLLSAHHHHHQILNCRFQLNRVNLPLHFPLLSASPPRSLYLLVQPRSTKNSMGRFPQSQFPCLTDIGSTIIEQIFPLLIFPNDLPQGNVQG